jgi:hypothetical protein
MNSPGIALQTLTDKLVATREGSIGWIVFNNPERHNAVSLEMWQSLPLVLDAFAADPEVRVIVLKGAGEKAFVSGADISQFKEKRSGAEAVKVYNDTADAASEALRGCIKPTIAMIRGYCIGGGRRPLRRAGWEAWPRLPLLGHQPSRHAGGTVVCRGNLFHGAPVYGAGSAADGLSEPGGSGRRA